MALIFPFSSEMGAEFPHAYGRVTHIEGAPDRIVATMQVYAGRAARLDGKQPVSIHTVAYEPDLTAGASDLFAQAYTRFQQESQFANATQA